MTAREAEAASPVEAARGLLRGWFADHFARLQSLSDQLVANLAFDAQGHLDISDSTRRKLKAVAVRFLAEDATIDGCGLIFAHTALGAENGHLEWWVREDETRFARYSFGVVPGADRYYDYEHLEWFVRAYEEGAPTLAGPYIDYLGVEAYVLTLTVPAELEGRRVGAVGNDIQLKDLEAELLPILLECPEEAALVSRHGNVLFANTSRFLPGDWVPDALEGFDRAAVSAPSAGVQLLTARA